MLLSYRWIYLAYTDLLAGPEVPRKVSKPPKVSSFLVQVEGE